MANGELKSVGSPAADSECSGGDARRRPRKRRKRSVPAAGGGGGGGGGGVTSCSGGGVLQPAYLSQGVFGSAAWQRWEQCFWLQYVHYQDLDQQNIGKAVTLLGPLIGSVTGSGMHSGVSHEVLPRK